MLGCSHEGLAVNYFEWFVATFDDNFATGVGEQLPIHSLI